MKGHSRKWQLFVVIGMLAAAGLFVAWWFSHPSDDAGSPQKAFYTVDGGTTLFTDSATKAPPFDYDGHPAVRAMVFSADNGAHRWVQYLFRYTDREKASLAAFPTATPSMTMGEVQRPGTTTWYPMNDPHVGEITYPKAPAGMGSNFGSQVFP